MRNITCLLLPRCCLFACLNWIPPPILTRFVPLVAQMTTCFFPITSTLHVNYPMWSSFSYAKDDQDSKDGAEPPFLDASASAKAVVTLSSRLTKSCADRVASFATCNGVADAVLLAMRCLLPFWAVLTGDRWFACRCGLLLRLPARRCAPGQSSFFQQRLQLLCSLIPYSALGPGSRFNALSKLMFGSCSLNACLRRAACACAPTRLWTCLTIRVRYGLHLHPAWPALPLRSGMRGIGGVALIQPCCSLTALCRVAHLVRL